MKKYIIKDNSGNKKTIYARNLTHALSFADNKVKDEANLATTIQALVNDEEAAVKAYEVAIKNLEGKIDETQMQVLINIMKDERKHIENLYAVLNGQVTEKNLEDSRVRDGRHTNKFARILRSKGINFTITPDDEIKFNNRNDFKKALDLIEDYSFEFGGYDYSERDMLIAPAE